MYELYFDRNGAGALYQYSKQFGANGRGYMEMQRTRPQTIGYSLADSPAGMLAWIYDKLVSWTDDYPWTDDEGEPFDFGVVKL
jgi:hypothetical protein